MFDRPMDSLECVKREGFQMKRMATLIVLMCALVLISGCSGSPEPKAADVKTPVSSSSARGQNVDDIALRFEKAGFTNVAREPMGDLIIGLLHGEGDVEEISIDGNIEFEEGDAHNPDAKVVIRYHSYPANNDATESPESPANSDGPSDEAAADADANASADSALAQTELSSESSSSVSSGSDQESTEAAGDEKAEREKLAKECSTKTADQAWEIADKAGYSVKLLDKDGFDLGAAWDDEAEGKKIADSKVIEAKFEEATGFFGTSKAELTLDYSVKKTMKGCKGETAEHALGLAEIYSWDATFVDGDGNDVTERMRDYSVPKSLAKAQVTKVSVSSGESSDTPSVEFTLDYFAVITAENNSDLAAILAFGDPGDPQIAKFAEKYDGAVIEFDGCIQSLSNHEGAKTRYDLLIGAGDYDPNSMYGPNFQFNDVNMYDLHLTGNVPDSLKVGMNVRVRAQVVEYSDMTQLFELDPVETEVR